MPTKLSDKAQEGSSFGIVAEFYEVHSDGSPVTPVTPNAGLTWTLKDGDGNVINGRARVPLTPAQVVFVVLGADDLTLSSDYPETRHIIIDGTYDSLLGDGLEIRDEAIIQVENLSDLPPEE